MPWGARQKASCSLSKCGSALDHKFLREFSTEIVFVRGFDLNIVHRVFFLRGSQFAGLNSFSGGLKTAPVSLI